MVELAGSNLQALHNAYWPHHARAQIVAPAVLWPTLLSLWFAYDQVL